MNKVFQLLKQLWSATGFYSPELALYAEKHLLDKTRIGVMSTSCLLFIIVLAAMAMNKELNLDSVYLYTYLLVAFLAVHVFFSARSINELKTLNMLVITLLVLSATAFVSIAHKTGGFTPLLFSNVVLLFMLVPLIPWGLREAVAVILVVYFMITLSIGGRLDIFNVDTLLILQFFMLAAGVISSVLVGFNVAVRKGDLKARFELEKSHDKMHRLSNMDPLTGSWNRRFLPVGLAMLKERFPSGRLHYAIFDLDEFKNLNDTHGHNYGDKILQLIVDSFNDNLAENGFLVRLGGDEFVLLMVADELETTLTAIRDRIRQRLENENRIKNSDFGLSLGRVNVPLDGAVNLQNLYKQADDILYKIKRSRYIQADDFTEKKFNYDVDLPSGKGSNWRLAI